MVKQMIDGEQFTLKLYQPYWYDVDTTKINSVKDIAELITALKMKVSTDYENFDKVKKFLIIPEEPKGLEYYQKEIEDKFEELLVKTKRKFAVSQESAEYHYNNKCKLINDNFEYAKTYGYFRPKITLYGVDGSLLVSEGNGLSWADPYAGATFEVKPDKNSVGYWDVPPSIRIWLKKKPNPIVRYFCKLLLNFTWKDK